MTSKHSRNMFA